jgi:2-C-methyl-D-erythritol 2,4-cyclodiphosphate synthase
MSQPIADVQLPRIGIGTDVHPFDVSRELHVAGLFWPGEVGLAGHSDGDVVAHACCDAMLGAAGLGDLGQHFGTSQPQWAGASGEALLRQTAVILRESGWRLGNISVQLIGNQPKFAPRRAESREVLSTAVGAPVSVSATTTDGLGLTGRGEGLAAIAVALVIPNGS